MTVSPDAASARDHGTRPLTAPASAPPKVWASLKKHGLAATLIAILAVAGIGAIVWKMTAKGSVEYVTAPIARGKISRTATATGTVNPVLTIIVGTYVSGVIQNIYCDYNTQVRAGQVCAKIDPRPYQATLDQYSGQLLRDQAILSKDQTDLTRYQQLSAQNSIARQQAEDQSYVVSQDQATVKLDQGLVQSAQLNLDYTNIISPVDGTVVSRSVTGGQTVAASFQTPTLFLIASDLKQMEVDTNTSEGDMGGVKEGNPATFTVDAYPQRVFNGTVTQVRQSPQTVQNVVTYDVVIGVDNNDLALMPGMTASTQIIIEQKNDVLRVPDQALRYTPSGTSRIAAAGESTTGKQRVWVLRNGEPVAVQVVTGLDDGNYTEIVQGDLHEGDQVISAETGPAGNPSSLPAPRL